MAGFPSFLHRPLRSHLRWLLAAALIAGGAPALVAQMSAADATALKNALSAYDQGRTQEAQGLLQELLRRHPHNFDVNEALGLTYAEAGAMQQALPLLAEAARVRPDSGPARGNLGTAYLKTNQPDKAISELEAAARLQPDNQQTQASLAHCLMELHKPARAAQAFAAAARLGPLDLDTVHDRALALLLSHDAPGAERVLDEVPPGSRTDVIEELAGEVEEQLGHYQQAEQHFSQAAHLNPSEPNLYAWIVELLRHFSWQPAIRIADYGIRQYPASTRMQAARGIALYADNRNQDAAAVFSTLLKEDPENEMWASMLGRNCALSGNNALAACDNLLQFARQHPRNAQAATYAATSLMHQPDPAHHSAEARRLLEQALKADPQFADAWYQMGVLQQEQSQWGESIVSLKKATALQPSLAEAHYRLARAYSHLGQHASASAEIALQQHYIKQKDQDVDLRLKEMTTFLIKSQ